jgi:flavin-dependent thymidylate synthase
VKVLLAGFNLDTGTIKELARGKTRLPLTPETISAAYARISRSPKSVDELRNEARKEVEKARSSNRRIIFEMSHHSIAEHAVFNFDIIGISRLAVEELEKFRLCSYTEKSQRYVTLKGDFLIPEEIKNANFLDEYLEMIARQNALYQELFEKLRSLNIKKKPKMAKDPRCLRILENLAKEDARYILPLATQTQLGATINARNLELMIRRFASHSLCEVRQLGGKLYEPVKKIAPSIILFCRANDFDEKTYAGLKKYRGVDVTRSRGKSKSDVTLVDHTRNGDDKVLAALLFRSSNASHAQCLKAVAKMSRRKKLKIFEKACCYMELYDAPLREFEFAHLTFSLSVSAGCFGQLKRHRLATITSQDYDPELGYTIPPAVIEAGEKGRFAEIVKRSEKVYEKIEKRLPGIGAYVLTNAHHKRVLMDLNLRELYHVSRLREDPTAQWDIRDKTRRMSELAKKVMPVTTSLLCGKTDYPKTYRRLFGRDPKVTEVPPPG